MEEIKKTLKDLFSFDVEENFYEEEEKNALVDMFKDVLFTDDETVREFLQRWFADSMEIAREFDLIEDEEESGEESGEEEEPTDDENGEEESGEEEEPTDDENGEEPTEDDQQEESVEDETEESEEVQEHKVTAEQAYIRTANRYLI